MAKIVDKNGFWLSENRPITKVGVYQYLGKQISPHAQPDKIYNVYRSESEVGNDDTVESFNGLPFIEDHEMVGKDFTKYDDRPAGGVVFNTKYNSGDKTVYGDLKIYSEKIQRSIDAGKKELSMGYYCDYEKASGVYNGQPYEYKQTNITGNHIALVDRGRMGSEVRVFDSVCNRAFDSIIIENTKETTMDSLRELLSKKGMDGKDVEEVIECVAEIASKDEKWKEDNKEEEGKDNDPVTHPKDGEKEASDNNEAEDEKEEEMKPEGKAEDSFSMDEIIKMVDRRNALKEKVIPFVGNFSCDGETENGVAVYACKKLNLEHTEDNAIHILNGYLSGCKTSQNNNNSVANDSDVYTSNGMDAATERLMKG